jgi:hypothetical protein
MIIPTPSSSTTSADSEVPELQVLLSNTPAPVLWSKPRWAPGVFARTTDAWPRKSLPLHVRLLRMTSLACRKCDAQGHNPFTNMRGLQVPDTAAAPAAATLGVAVLCVAVVAGAAACIAVQLLLHRLH